VWLTIGTIILGIPAIILAGAKLIKVLKARKNDKTYKQSR